MQDTPNYRVTNLIGTPTDYSDENNWARLPTVIEKEVDTFFVYPTLYIDPNPTAPVISSIEDKTIREAVEEHYPEAPLVFEDSTNVFEPYYRQSNLCALMGKGAEDNLALSMREQRTDLYAALDYYFDHYNQGRPYILAGHSQGSMMLKIALTDYFKEHVDYLDNMVATYALGFSITTDDLEANPALRFAEGADDTGVIVSWNLEGPENKHAHSDIVLDNAISINPLNWRRDETYAPASMNLGDRLPISDGKSLFAQDFQVNHPGLADAQVDVERGVVVCTTLPDFYIKDVVPGQNPFGPASLHVCDYPAYWDNIKENVKTRIQSFLNKA